MRPLELANLYHLQGSLSARIGFVLDYAAMSSANDVPLDSAKRNSLDYDLPRSIRGCGFNTENAILWTYNFQEFSTLNQDDFIEVSQGNRYEELHEAVIQGSAAKVILLCGPRAEKVIKDTMNSFNQYTLELQGYKFPIYLGNNIASTEIRLYIRCPVLPSQVWCVNTAHSVRLSEILRFAVNILGMTEIRPYFVESSSVVGSILCQTRKEKLGAPVMTTDTLDPGIRLWLRRKGVGDEEDIRKIEVLGGSLMRGLMIVMHALPRQETARITKLKLHQSENQPGVKVRAYTTFGPESFQQVKALVHDRIQKREDEITKRLSTLPTDTREPNREQAPLIEENEPPMDAESHQSLWEEENESRLAIESFSQLGDEQPENLVEIQSLLSHRQSEITNLEQVTASLAEKDIRIYEPRIEDLVPLVKETSTDGFLDPDTDSHKNTRKGGVRRGQTTGKSRKGYTRRVWRDETKVFQNKEYGYNLPLGVTYERSISLNYCPIKFSPGLDVGNGHLLVKIEICPSGQRHPDAYATSANDEDPACRLAFRERYTDSTGLEVQYYEKNPDMSPLFRANAFVDVLADEIPSELIAQMPRRYLAFKKGQAPLGVEIFEGGNYTTSLSGD